MTESPAIVVDTMAVSAVINADRDPETATHYRQLIAGRPVVVSFVTITEMRYGAIKAGWGELRTRALDRSLSNLVVVQPDEELMRTCAALRARCERDGHALGQVHEADRWIGATALRLGLELVSDDAVFAGALKDSRSARSRSDPARSRGSCGTDRSAARWSTSARTNRSGERARTARSRGGPSSARSSRC